MDKEERKELINMLDEIMKTIQESNPIPNKPLWHTVYKLDDIMDCLDNWDDDLKTLKHFQKDLKYIRENK